MKPPIFITGCPRSGTSLYCGCLARCGAVGGKVCGATGANPKGQYENSAIRNKLIKPYLRSIGADPLGQYPLPDQSHLKPYPGLRNDFYGMLKEQGLQEDEVWYMKVCKACLIWPVFDKAFPDAKWIIVRREKDDIINSCQKTSFMRKRTSKESWSEWVDYHVERFIEMKAAMPDRVMEVWPSDLVSGDFTTIKQSIEWLGLEWNEKAILSWIDKKLWHGK
mgnify:CR=1 FL=1